MILLKNNYYEEDEKLFSTGDLELDDILEEVYYSGISDGYDYAQREFAEKSKLGYGARTDVKFIRKINNKFGVTGDDNIKEYKEALKNPNLSDKERKQLNALIDEQKLADGKMSEDEFIEKYPRAKRGAHTTEYALDAAAGAGALTAAGLGVAALGSLKKDPAKAKKLAKAGAITGLSAAGLGTASSITSAIKDKRAEKKNK